MRRYTPVANTAWRLTVVVQGDNARQGAYNVTLGLMSTAEVAVQAAKDVVIVAAAVKVGRFGLSDPRLTALGFSA